MLKNNIYYRFLCTCILAILAIYFPISIVAVFIPIFIFGNYVESLLIGMIIDTLYGLNGSILYTSTVFVAFVIIEVIKRRMRL